MTIRQTYMNLSVEELETWVASRRQEDLHLDFKVLDGVSELNRDDRKNFAKSISGFANSDGGLIVWGVEAKRDKSGVDGALRLVPIPNGLFVLSKLHSLTGDATSPAVEGVEHRLISDRGDSCFLATIVPASDSGPHMAMLGEQRYYKRSGDSFYVMEHFDVADMFGRRRGPRLSLDLSPGVGSVSSSRGSRSARVEVIVALSNTGRGVASFPYVKLRISSGYKICFYELDGNGNAGLPRRVRPAKEMDWAIYAGGANDVVHPETNLQITLIVCNVPETVESLPDLVVEYTIASEGVRPQSGEARVAGMVLLKLAITAMDASFPKQSG
ncbi:AlbA family DNA-binding domain-containing protein [Sorangium sp. So ce1000]|uniref:AlbA family DNA-binding domain-containing protein n=1 Tax=Sorangium sp. So ce1000 TaxID=3133325 RepID=UPI003F5ED19F